MESQGCTLKLNLMAYEYSAMARNIILLRNWLIGFIFCQSSYLHGSPELGISCWKHTLTSKDCNILLCFEESCDYFYSFLVIFLGNKSHHKTIASFEKTTIQGPFL